MKRLAVYALTSVIIGLLHQGTSPARSIPSGSSRGHPLLVPRLAAHHASVGTGRFESVNQLAVHDLIQRLEVRNVEGAYGLNGQSDAFLGGACTARSPDAFSCLPQNAQNARPIEPLTLAVVAKAHA